MATLEDKTPSFPADFSDSKYLWAETPASTINQFVSFEHRFPQPSASEVWLHLFADTRYRLYVNEQLIAHGPGRFVTQFPEYDSHELSAWLQAGENCVRVEVNFYGCSSYQSMPDGAPGFIATGHGEGYDFRTPGHWLTLVHQAWTADAPHFSFAQNPVEICDTRILTDELAHAPRSKPVALENGPWGALAPRSAPMPAYTQISPARIVRGGALLDDWLRVGFQSKDPSVQFAAKPGQQRRRFATWIHAPEAIETTLHCFWNDLELNGEPLEVDKDSPLGNHNTSAISLREGWNFLSGNLAVLTSSWPYQMALEKSSGACFYALPELTCECPLAISPLEAEACPLLPYQPPTNYELPEGWSLCDGAMEPLTPARSMAWDRFSEESSFRDVPYQSLAEVAEITATQASWTFDFGDQFYGHPVIEVNAPEGTVMDVAYDDWCSESGTANLYTSNPFTDAADRYLLKGGPQRVEVLNPRGGIFLQITLRLPGGTPAPVELCSLHVASRRTLDASQSKFECPDEVFNWAYDKSLHTLVASTDESYADCPWRERGCYLGDAYVNLHLHSLISEDLSIARRCLSLFAQSQLEDGRMHAVAPAWLRRPHEDFTLIWPLFLRDYWAISGDLETVRRLWPNLLRIWQSPFWQSHESGLWNTCEGMNMFIDWGVKKSDREGECNAVLNLLRYGALQVTAELAQQLGDSTAADYQQEAEQVGQAIVEQLWDEEKGRFKPSLAGDGIAMHANTLALLFGLGDSARLLAFLKPRLGANLQHGLRNGTYTGYLELYFTHYLLPALAKHKEVALAEEFIHEHFAFLKDLDYPTLNECFARAHLGGGSCCHSWSGAVAIFLARVSAGLQQKTPGDRLQWVLNPQSTKLDKMELAVPVPGGLIELNLQRTDSGWEAQVVAPEHIHIEAASGVALQRATAKAETVAR